MLQKLQVFIFLLCAWGPLLQGQAKRPTPAVSSTKTLSANDVLDRTNFPARFRGYAVDKASSHVIIWFQGTWVEAPTNTGGGTGVTWSRRAARLQLMDANPNANVLAISFNLGQKDGRWVVRQFKWIPDEAKPNQFKPVPLLDEGSGELADGIYRFELDQMRVVLLPNENGWHPTSLRVYRFSGDDFTAPSTLVPCIAHTFGQGPTQLAPVWAAGSYFLMEDGPLGRLVYRGFAEQGNTWVIRYAREGEKVVRGGVEPYEGSIRKDKGTWPFVALYENGLGLTKSDFYGANSMALDLVFKDPARLEEVRFDGKAWGAFNTPSMQFSLHGTSTEITIPDPVREEALSRSSDPEWLASGGPYSPQKLLNMAFQGCTAQFPLSSVNQANTSGAAATNEKNKQGAVQRLPGWLKAFQECGVLTSRTLFTTRKPAPLGLLLTPEQVEKLQPAKAGKQ